MNLSKSAEELLIAYEKGYRVRNGIIYNPKGKIIKSLIDNRGYRVFTNSRYGPKVLVHRLVAYQKYGDKIFEGGIHVRHLDGDQKNNKDDNIEIGTPSQNQMDIPKEVRLATAIKASRKIRKFTDEEVDQIRTDYLNTRSYKLVMEKWNISSKGTLHYIINNNYVT